MISRGLQSRPKWSSLPWVLRFHSQAYSGSVPPSTSIIYHVCIHSGPFTPDIIIHLKCVKFKLWLLLNTEYRTAVPHLSEKGPCFVCVADNRTTQYSYNHLVLIIIRSNEHYTHIITVVYQHTSTGYFTLKPDTADLCTDDGKLSNTSWLNILYLEKINTHLLL